VPFATGLEAVRRLVPLAPAGATMAQFALRWVIDQPGVSTVIPGARSPEQAKANAAAADLEPLSADVLAAVEEVYRDVVAPEVAGRW
ncbi:aldo/keto reductase, partial [Microbacterium sp.]|uniref:aldo/keto reductase n=3 Tax=Microbacterium TaxID=33882 RepID=UPI003F9974CE